MHEEFTGKKIALLGGAGFIGHHLALELAERGALVSVVDSLHVNNLLTFSSSGEKIPYRELYIQMLRERLELLSQHGVALYPQDVRDYHALSRILGEVQPQVIVHLAAVSHAGRSNKDPYSTFDHSLRTLENALDCARGVVEQFIYFSSSMAYGNFKTPEVTEEHTLEPIGIYGALKLAGEKMVIAYHQVFDLPYTIIRPSALYGPRCVSRRVGQVFIENALAGANLRIEGDGKEKIDFTNIDDLVQGITLAIANPKARNEIFNITYGSARSVSDLATEVQKHFPNVTIEYSARDNLIPFRGTLSVKKAEAVLGYAPSVPIELGFSRYIDWYRGFRGTEVICKDAAVLRE